MRRPAELLSVRFETAGLADIITRRTAEDSVKDVGALPLLSYTLDDMWTQMMRRGDGRLRLPAQSFELGGVLVNRANSFLAEHPGAEDALRRILTLKLATVREDGEPTRRRAPRSEFSNDEWRLVGELADYPNRLLVTATSEAGETYAEVAHEAIFRRWEKLRDWIAAEREFLAWRTVLEAARRAWQATPNGLKSDALLMGAGLTQAQSWLEKRGTIDCHRSVYRSAQGARTRRAPGGARGPFTCCWSASSPGCWVDQSGVHQGAGELAHDHAALRGRECGPLRAQARGRAGAEAGGFFQGMREGLPRDGRRADGGIHDGFARQ